MLAGCPAIFNEHLQLLAPAKAHIPLCQLFARQTTALDALRQVHFLRGGQQRHAPDLFQVQADGIVGINIGQVIIIYDQLSVSVFFNFFFTQLFFARPGDGSFIQVGNTGADQRGKSFLQLVHILLGIREKGKDIIDGYKRFLSSKLNQSPNCRIRFFLFVPFVLRLPKGKRTYRQYLDDIGLTRVQPFIRLVLLGLSCYIILALSQAAASFMYRLSEGLPITWSFVRRVFDLSGDLPPGSSSLLVSFPSVFEEVVFRGIVLTVFLGKYSERKAIIFSSLGFGLMHLLNLASGRELVWVMGQVIWAFILGLFYGHVFVRTRSLLPPMIVHYLGNVFIGSLTGYMQSRTSIEMQALYGVIFSLGIVPTTLMILWARFFSSRWLTRKAIESHVQNNPTK